MRIPVILIRGAALREMMELAKLSSAVAADPVRLVLVVDQREDPPATVAEVAASLSAIKVRLPVAELEEKHQDPYPHPHPHRRFPVPR